MKHIEPLMAKIIYEDPEYWLWCPSTVQDETGRWHLFASRWPKSIPFHPGWLLRSEVIRAEADALEGPYKFAEVVMPARGADWWDGRSTHNPRVLRDGNRWIMFYMGATHPLQDPEPGEPLPMNDPRVIVSRWRKRTGVAVAETPSGPWKRPDSPSLETRSGKFDAWLASNPTACAEPDGGWFLVYKGRPIQGPVSAPVHGPMSLGVARAKHAEGPWERLDRPVFPADGIGEVEDPFVWRSPRGYELLFKDMSSRLTGVHHALVRAWSENGLDWKLDEQPLLSDRRVVWPDGREQTLGSMERPSLVFQEQRATHLLAAAGDGIGGFENFTSSFLVLAEMRRAESSL